MDTKRFLILVLLVFILNGCQRPAVISTPQSSSEPTDGESDETTVKPAWTKVYEDAEIEEAFAIYLLADPQISGSDLSAWALDALPLAETPLILVNDVLLYDWENHTLDVTEESYQHITEAIGGSVPVNGRPFVVVANDERIYAGAFWTLASSLSFSGVVIMDPAFSENRSLTFTLGYPTEEYFNGDDPRDDSRIWEVLEKLGLVQ